MLFYRELKKKKKLEREENLLNYLFVLLLPFPTSEGLGPEAILESSFSLQM